MGAILSVKVKPGGANLRHSPQGSILTLNVGLSKEP